MGEASEMFMRVKKKTERDKERERVCARARVCVCVRACGCGGRKARFLTDCDRRTDGILVGRCK